MKRIWRTAACVSALWGSLAYANAETLTIATVNNGDMIRMQKLASEFTKANPDISLNWVTLEENALREKVTTDIATKAGQFDILTIGTYEVPIWAKKGWLTPLDLGKDYDVDDLLPPIRAGLSYENKLYAAPFYGESSFVIYRKDLLAKAGLTMPEQPTWDFVADAAKKMSDPSTGTYGICLRGKAGWGENMAFIDLLANSFGARWFDENWKPQFDQPEWKAALNYYVNLVKSYGPPGASTNGFQENLHSLQPGQMRHLDRRDIRWFIRDRPKAVHGLRQGRLRTGSQCRQGQERQLAVGMVACHSGFLPEGRDCREIPGLGNQQGLPGPRRREGRLV